MESAVKQGLPKGVALADAAYGNVEEFRAGLRWPDFEYAVGVNATTVVARASKATVDASPMSVEALARKLPRNAFRATTWKQGSRRALWSRFAMLQVDAGNADGGHHWLLIEWPKGEKAPTHYTLARLRNGAQPPRARRHAPSRRRRCPQAMRQHRGARRGRPHDGCRSRCLEVEEHDEVDHFIVLGERHLLRLVRQHVAYHNEDRPHMSLSGDARTGPPSNHRVPARSSYFRV
jgi:hypothetical protein